MSIQVSGGGSVAVTTEALLDARRGLMRLAFGAGEVTTDLGRAALTPPAVDDAVAALVGRARRELDAAAEQARRLADELERAAEEYGWAERAALAVQQFLAFSLGPEFLLGGTATLAALDAARPGGPDFRDPELVAALRALADSLDLGGLVVIAQLLPGRELQETPVTVTATHGDAPARAAAPGGFADLARRIPSSGDGAPQLRIERYVLPGGVTHWIVYSAGTAEWGPVPSDDPWDLTSDVVGVAGGSAGSTRAALLALRAAGWEPGEPVIPVGHSQGGIVATSIAASGVAAVPLLVTFGSPTAGVPAPAGTLDVAVEHTDDVVPPLGGSPPAFTDRRLVVREAAPVSGSAGGLAAHAMSGYGRTAAEMDASSDERLAAARSALRDFTGGRPAQVTLWRGDRVSPSVSGGPAASAGGR